MPLCGRWDAHAMACSAACVAAAGVQCRVVQPGGGFTRLAYVSTRRAWRMMARMIMGVRTTVYARSMHCVR